MKTTSIAIALALTASPASAQTCTFASGMAFCSQPSQGFAGGFAEGYARSAEVRERYAELNTYRQLNGLPRCHYGILGAIISASSGEPMC